MEPNIHTNTLETLRRAFGTAIFDQRTHLKDVLPTQNVLLFILCTYAWLNVQSGAFYLILSHVSC